jgi:Domain of unknown function (DUF4258)
MIDFSKILRYSTVYMPDKIVPISSKTKPLPISDAQRIINELALKTSNIKFTAHARERMVERDMTDADVYEILRTGIIKRKPKKEGKDWCYRVELLGFESPVGVVITAIKGKKVLLPITVHRGN